MAEHEGTARPPRGRVAKRDAITRAARTVFGRDGYIRAGIEAIAAEAEVSTRTIYNHFDGKEQLFTAVIEDSAKQVAEALTAIIERHLGAVADLEGALISLGRDWATPQADFAEHFAMVRHLTAEAAHLPRAILATWHEAGPRRAERVLAHHLRHLADQGLIHLDNPERAANHYIWLVLGEVNSHTYTGAPPLNDAEKADLITAGAQAFLHGYLPRPATP